MNILLERILPNPEQPRKHFDAGELQGLAQSILENGVLMPVLVEQAGERYILHDGERRCRAAKMAGLTEISATVVPPLNGTAKEDRLVRALVANIQRADLDPIEEAKSFKALSENGLSNNRIAVRLGISPMRVKDRLNLLELEAPIQDLISSERLSKDARLVSALLLLPKGNTRIQMAQKIADRNVTIKAGVEACRHLAESLLSAHIPENEVPALRFAGKKAGDLNKISWNALMQVGKVPPWLLVEISARDVCSNCSLRDSASETVCRGCALVEMLARMIGKTK